MRGFFLAFLDAATRLGTAVCLGATTCLKAVSWVSGEPSSLLRRIQKLFLYFSKTIQIKYDVE